MKFHVWITAIFIFSLFSGAVRSAATSGKPAAKAASGAPRGSLQSGSASTARKATNVVVATTKMARFMFDFVCSCVILIVFSLVYFNCLILHYKVARTEEEKYLHNCLYYNTSFQFFLHSKFFYHVSASLQCGCFTFPIRDAQ